MNLVSRPTPGLDTRVTSTTGGTGPTSDIGILPSSSVWSIVAHRFVELVLTLSFHFVLT